MADTQQIDKPDAPPVDIKKGLATWLGLAGVVVAAITSALTRFLGDNPDLASSNAKIFAGISAVIAVVTIIGRMLQSAAAIFAVYRDAPSPGQLNDASGEEDVVDDEEDLDDDVPTESEFDENDPAFQQARLAAASAPEPDSEPEEVLPETAITKAGEQA